MLGRRAVQQSVKVEFAKAFGITFPPTLLGRADAVIELDHQLTASASFATSHGSPRVQSASALGSEADITLSDNMGLQ
jgi:hypothetical protein